MTTLPRTAIPYARYAWQIVTGCTPVSAGCDHCWARTMLHRRLPGMGHAGDESCVQFHADRIGQPAATKRPGVVFVAPMGDLFHEAVHPNALGAVWNAMADAPHHTYLMLTKRPERARWFIEETGPVPGATLPNVWLGVSLEDQATADERLPILAGIDWPNKWVSVEPQLGPVSVKPFKHGLGWVVCGCESGPKRRPFETPWAHKLLNECWEHHSDGRMREHPVPFYFKQKQDLYGRVMHAPVLDGRQWLQTPEGWPT